MAPRIPPRPGHPERICWGCEHFCPADDMRCGNGTERAQHPVELWGDDWMSIGRDGAEETKTATGTRDPDSGIR
ncbi:MAG TPA: DUF3079 domain-containing protein [Steroidobacteraceae bacterium]|nr:DUF3079 domain-containing protein [Steroidobacteraceae bacterium]